MKSKTTAEIASLDELRLRRYIVGLKIQQLKKDIKADINPAEAEVAASAGWKTLNRVATVVSAAKMGYTGYKLYKKFSKVVRSFRNKH